MIWAQGGSNAGVGVELEFVKEGQRIFVPLHNGSVPGQVVLTAPTGSGSEGFWWRPNWALNYAAPTGRYRSVCITNYSGFISSHTPAPSSPWQYD